MYRSLRITLKQQTVYCYRNRRGFAWAEDLGSIPWLENGEEARFLTDIMMHSSLEVLLVVLSLPTCGTPSVYRLGEDTDVSIIYPERQQRRISKAQRMSSCRLSKRKCAHVPEARPTRRQNKRSGNDARATRYTKRPSPSTLSVW